MSIVIMLHDAKRGVEAIIDSECLEAAASHVMNPGV